MQPWHTPFPIWNQSIVPCLVLTVGFWPAYRFLRRQVKWSGIPIYLRISHSVLWSTVKVFSIVNEAEVDVFLKFSCFFYDPMDVGNLISGSSAFSKSSLNIFNRWETQKRMYVTAKVGPSYSPGPALQHHLLFSLTSSEITFLGFSHPFCFRVPHPTYLHYPSTCSQPLRYASV